MKKLLSLGAIGVVVAPVVVAMSCGSASTEKNYETSAKDIGRAFYQSTEAKDVSDQFSKLWTKNVEIDGMTGTDQTKAREKFYGKIIKGFAAITVPTTLTLNKFVSTVRDDDKANFLNLFNKANTAFSGITTQIEADKYNVTLAEAREATLVSTNLMSITTGDVANDSKQITIGAKKTDIDELVTALMQTLNTTQTEKEFKDIILTSMEMTTANMMSKLGVTVTIPTTSNIKVVATKVKDSVTIKYVISSNDFPTTNPKTIEIKYTDFKFDFTNDLAKVVDQTSTKDKATLAADVGEIAAGTVVTNGKLGITNPTLSQGVSISYVVKELYVPNTGKIVVTATLSKGSYNATKDITITASNA